MGRRRSLVIPFLIAFVVTLCESKFLDDLREKFHKIKEIPEVKEFARKLSEFSFDEVKVFDFFKENFEKDYENVAEEHSALLKFLLNQRKIHEHNARYKKGLETFKMDVWRFSDLTSDEINSAMNGFIRPVQAKAKALDSIDIVPPDFVNWTAKGYVTSVKNQKLCGSCWSFATAGAIEGQMFKQTGVLRNLSEQNLIDCNRNDDTGNFGCEGGDMITAFKFVAKQKGIALEAKYPYEASDKKKCRYKKSSSGGAIKSFLTIVSGNETLLKAFVAKYGPVASAVDASLPSFQSYKSGIYFDRECTKQINHAVLIVGYGTDNETNKDYWLVKNSYGKTWGEYGYFKLARNEKNHCGIAEFATVPVP